MIIRKTLIEDLDQEYKGLVIQSSTTFSFARSYDPNTITMWLFSWFHAKLSLQLCGRLLGDGKYNRAVETAERCCKSTEGKKVYRFLGWNRHPFELSSAWLRQFIKFYESTIRPGDIPVSPADNWNRVGSDFYNYRWPEDRPQPLFEAVHEFTHAAFTSASGFPARLQVRGCHVVQWHRYDWRTLLFHRRAGLKSWLWVRSSSS